jgi:hypothetical protein
VPILTSLLASRAVIGAAALALIALAALHVLKPEVHPSRNMISQYALGRHGWVMALCFAAFAAASACLFVALVAYAPLLLGRIGLAFLLAAAIGLAMAARFPMDPVSTPPAQMSFSGKMHGLAFVIGVPCQILAVLLLSLALQQQDSRVSLPLLSLAAVVWLSLGITIAIMLIVGPGKLPNPNGPERFLGWPNRLFMVSYAAWLMVAAWPMARPLEAIEWRGHLFREVRGLVDLPTPIQSRLRVGRAGLEGIADRDHPFNVTDVVDDRLPMRRLLAAGQDGDTWLVAVEVGGVGYSVEVLLFSALDSTPKQRWALLARPRTLREAVQELSKRGVLPED